MILDITVGSSLEESFPPQTASAGPDDRGMCHSPICDPAAHGRASATTSGDPHRPATIHRFVVSGAATPDLPLRVLNLLAQQSLILDRVELTRENARHVILVECGEVSARRAAVLIEKMRAIPFVEDASLGTTPLNKRGAGCDRTDASAGRQLASSAQSRPAPQLRSPAGREAP